MKWHRNKMAETLRRHSICSLWGTNWGLRNNWRCKYLDKYRTCVHALRDKYSNHYISFLNKEVKELGYVADYERSTRNKEELRGRRNNWSSRNNVTSTDARQNFSNQCFVWKSITSVAKTHKKATYFILHWKY